MKFGRCNDCKEYKYLEKNRTCPSCVSEEWAVVSVYVMSGICKVYKENLTKDEARKLANGRRGLVTVKQSEVKSWC